MFSVKMLILKQEALRASVRDLEDSIAYIDWKQNFYDEVLSGKRPYVSNLIPVEEKTMTGTLSSSTSERVCEKTCLRFFTDPF